MPYVKSLGGNMSRSQLYRKWFQRYIKAIHRHDQCQAMADDLEAQGNPKAGAVRKLRETYAFFIKVAAEQVEHYRKSRKR